MSDYVTGGNIAPSQKPIRGLRVTIRGNRYVMPYMSMILTVPLIAAMFFLSFGVALPALQKQAAWAARQQQGYAAVQQIVAVHDKGTPISTIIANPGKYLPDSAALINLRAGSCTADSADAYTLVTKQQDGYYYVFTSHNQLFQWLPATSTSAAIKKACAA